MREKKLKSYKIFNKIDSGLEFILIAPKGWSLKQLNGLIQNGMKCVVVDQRSELVNKEFVE